MEPRRQIYMIENENHGQWNRRLTFSYADSNDRRSLMDLDDDDYSSQSEAVDVMVVEEEDEKVRS